MAMDRAIFDLKLSVEATSLYILICSHRSGDRPPTRAELLPLWNGGPDQFAAAAAELRRHGILINALPLRDDEPLQIAGRHCWH